MEYVRWFDSGGSLEPLLGLEGFHDSSCNSMCNIHTITTLCIYEYRMWVLCPPGMSVRELECGDTIGNFGKFHVWKCTDSE